MKKTKIKILLIVLLILSAISFVAAGYYFRKSITLQVSYNQYLERLRSMPGPHDFPSSEDEALVRNQVLEWQAMGSMLIFTGIGLIILPLLFYRKTRTVALMILVLLTATFAAVPRSFAVGYTPDLLWGDRWYVYHELTTPTNAIASYMTILPKPDYCVTEDKPNLTDPSYSFVAFWLNLKRVDVSSGYYQREYLQVGFLHNSTGLWLYGEIVLFADPSSVHTEAMIPYSPKTPLLFSIYEIEPNHYRAIVQPQSTEPFSVPEPPGEGAITLAEFTFSFTGKPNEYKVSSESNNPNNYISFTRFSDLAYFLDSKQPWNDISPGTDSPYHNITVSPYDFIAFGGYYGVQHFRRGSGYLLVSQDRPT